jgi:hypothetical protein
MNGWELWGVLRIILLTGGLIVAGSSLVIGWRLRGIFHWKRSLGREIAAIEKEAAVTEGARGEALALVSDRCRKLWRTGAPDLGELSGIPDYIRAIAAVYHPGREKPELCVTTGGVLRAAREIADHLDRLLSRPGFQRLHSFRIRHLKQTYRWYRKAEQSRFLGRLLRFHKVFIRFYRFQLVLFLEPLSLAAYFSQRLTLLVLTRCLVCDTYLFTGRLAAGAYAEAGPEEPEAEPFPEEVIEETLENLEKAERTQKEPDPDIEAIRSRLVGFPAVFFSPPGLEDLKRGIVETAGIIARRNFPDAERPLEEAAIGPLLARTRFFLQALCGLEKFRIVQKLHRIPVSSLHQIKSISDVVLSKQVRRYAKNGWGVYRFLEWPLRIYRLMRKASPVGLAVGMGWVLARKGMINLFYRFAFDTARKELETIYSESREVRLDRRFRKPAEPEPPER